MWGKTFTFEVYADFRKASLDLLSSQKIDSYKKVKVLLLVVVVVAAVAAIATTAKVCGNILTLAAINIQGASQNIS